MVKFSTQRLAAAGALSPPAPGMYLVNIKTISGATPGSFSIIYATPETAHFWSSPRATLTHDFKLAWLIKGSNVPAGLIAFNGGIVAVELQYADSPIGDPRVKDISAYRATRQARTDAVATTANLTFTYDVQPALPKFLQVLISASTGRMTLPATDVFTETIEATQNGESGSGDDPFPVSDFSKPANTLVVSGITDGASTIQGLLIY